MSRRSINLGNLSDVAEERASQLGYPSVNAYFKALLRYDLLVAGEHTITQPVAESPPHVQDRFDERLIAKWKAGDNERGSYLKWVLRQLCEDEEKREEIKSDLPKKLS